MQEQHNSNVVSLFTTSSATSPSHTPMDLPHGEVDEGNSEQAFRALMKRNADNQKRLQQDRLKANKSVLKSYRIKK